MLDLDICRICLQKTEYSNRIFELPDDEEGISCTDILKNVFHIEIVDQPKFPTNVCQECDNRLRDAFKFRLQIIENQRWLEESFKEVFSEIKPEVEVSIEAIQEVSDIEVRIGQDSKVVEEKIEQKESDVDVEQQLPIKKLASQKPVALKKTTSKSTKKSKPSEEDRIIKEFYGLICNNCDENRAFDSLYQLREHNRSIHSIKVTIIECCSKQFKRRGHLLDHAKTHINPEELQCKECGKQCINRYRLKVHILQNHRPDDVKSYQCKICQKRFLNQGNLKAHQRVHMSKEDKEKLKTHKCGQCNGTFISQSLLAHHIRQIHDKVYTCICDICAKSFKTKMHFLSHYKLVHSAPELIRVQCLICMKWIANEPALKKHVRLNHADPGPHICGECGKEAPTKHALISHERYVHKSLRKFKCNYCVKAFKKPIHLREHVTTHVGGVLYKCNYCEKTFNSGANMYSHRKKKHLVEMNRDKEKQGLKT